MSKLGGSGPERITAERKPDCCRAIVKDRSRFVEGILVRERRALEQFCRCEHVFARCISDIAEHALRHLSQQRPSELVLVARQSAWIDLSFAYERKVAWYLTERPVT